MEIGEFNQTREIIHLGNYDLVINHEQKEISSSDLSILIQRITTEIKDVEASNSQDFLEKWHKIPSKRNNVSVDDEDKPKYIAKTKWVRPGNPDFDEQVILRTNLDEVERGNKLAWYGMNGVMSEMKNSNLVKDIVSEKSTQDLFTKNGYSAIEYIGPIVAVINKKTKEKVVIYKYVEGIIWEDYLNSMKGDQYYEGWNSLRLLKEQFKKNKIEPFDLLMQQFIYQTSTKKLYLIDAEAYIPTLQRAD